MRRLGGSGPEISVVGFGAWEAGGMWGENPPEDEMIAAMQAAFDGGMNWIDTAEVYGAGASEQLVGRAVAGRDDVMVFTKVAGGAMGSGYDAASVRKAAEASLRRLGRDVIDLYQIHFPVPAMPLEETWEAMARLVDDGLVRFVGVSNFPIDYIERCEQIRHVDSLQPNFSMLFRFGQRDLHPFCKRNGTGIIGYGPLGFGLLTGTITAETTFGEDDWRSGRSASPAASALAGMLFSAEARPTQLAIVERLRPVADRLGVTLGQLAIAWAFHQDGITGAIVGSRRSAHARANAAAGKIDLDDKDLEEIDAILGPPPA